MGVKERDYADRLGALVFFREQVRPVLVEQTVYGGI